MGELTFHTNSIKTAAHRIRWFHWALHCQIAECMWASHPSPWVLWRQTAPRGGLTLLIKMVRSALTVFQQTSSQDFYWVGTSESRFIEDRLRICVTPSPPTTPPPLPPPTTHTHTYTFIVLICLISPHTIHPHSSHPHSSQGDRPSLSRRQHPDLPSPAL